MNTHKRNLTITKLRARGVTQAAIGRMFGISRQRVLQIIDRHAPHLNTHHIRKPDVTLTCKQCGVDFKVRPQRGTVGGKYALAKYCSQPCSSLAQEKYHTPAEKRAGHNARKKWRYHNDPAYKRHLIDYHNTWNKAHRS